MLKEAEHVEASPQNGADRMNVSTGYLTRKRKRKEKAGSLQWLTWR
ncbi:hypothetical protein J8Z30_01825 [Escherichia coli]|nr:hypothetical protein J8Z30_01825 [Escherichia coli]